LNPGRRTAPLLRLVLLLCLLSSWTGCRTGSTAAVRREFTATRMGMPWRIVLYAASDREAEEAADAAWNRITELNRILSDYEPDSELSRLSRSSGSGTDVPVSEDLFRVLERAEQVSRAGDGSFDITVGPLVDVWKRARRQRALPDASRIAAARDACGWTNVVLGRDAEGRRTARLLRPGGSLLLSTISGDPADSGVKLSSSGDRVHMFYRQPETISAWLNEAGFAVLRLDRVASPANASHETVDVVILARRNSVPAAD
jgi:thiamine biosynthesis lipoprotein ApbE